MSAPIVTASDAREAAARFRERAAAMRAAR